jgi:DUF177 domain-containing protein
MIEYIIPVNGLVLGNHNYAFKIDDSFFKKFEYLEVEGGLLNLNVGLVKESTFLDFTFQFEGFIQLMCDRCLDSFKMEVEDNFRLIVKYADDYEEVSDEIITIPSSESNVDLSQYIYEYINLLLPIKKVHPNDEDGDFTCNEDMIERLNRYTEQKSDPRWDALKNLKLD